MNAYSDLFGPVSEHSHCIIWLFHCEGRNPWLKIYVKYYKKKRNSSLWSSHGAGPVDYWLSTKSKIIFFFFICAAQSQSADVALWFYLQSSSPVKTAYYWCQDICSLTKKNNYTSGLILLKEKKTLLCNKKQQKRMRGVLQINELGETMFLPEISISIFRTS